MASDKATRSNRNIHSRLPLTPKVTLNRRGRQSISTPVENKRRDSAATPAMHITPNAAIVARGDVRSSRYSEELSKSAQDLRRFRA